MFVQGCLQQLIENEGQVLIQNFQTLFGDPAFGGYPND